jgi:hypothetical protein
MPVAIGLDAGLEAPFYTGQASAPSSLVPAAYPVALAGHPYVIDLDSDRFRHLSVPILRQQADQSASPSETSITPEDLWRRSIDTWHKGAGQTHYDRPDSDSARFRSSKGVDIWTKWQLSLLPATDQKRSSANTNLKLQPAGSFLYLVDGTSVYSTQDVTVDSPTWTALTGTLGANGRDIASDGYYVWVTDGSDVYRFTRGASALGSAYNTLNCTVLGWVKGRLMAANAHEIFNITSATVPPALFSHNNTDFAWVGFAEGTGHIYAAGYSGDKSLIYRTAVKQDGSSLDTPVVAGELPDGEIVRSIGSYLGFVLLGTDKGVRFATPDANGDLTIGALLSTSSAVACFEGQDRFVWFGWTNYDATSTGLGRLDLTVFGDPDALAPAYASDLMATTQGAVESVVTFQSRRVFCVDGVGVFGEETTKVASGTIDVGHISYGLPSAEKVALFLAVDHNGTGQHSAHVSVDGGAFTAVGTHTTSTDKFPVGERRGRRFEHRLTLTTVAGASPTIYGATLEAYPAVDTVDIIIVPLLLHHTIRWEGQEHPLDPGDEVAFLKSLRDSQDVVTWQEFNTSYTVVLTDYEWIPFDHTTGKECWDGTFVAQLKVIA